MNDPLASIVRQIESEGPITLARFMELALYMPGCGYYERPREIGRHGDFYTSVSVGRVFGELLAFQFAEWLEALDAPKCVIMESGAHDGRLASDVLRWLAKCRPNLFGRTEYCFVEASIVRRAWQQRTIEAFAHETHCEPWLPGGVRWLSGVPTERSVRGVIFSNELFDAWPQHRLRWNASSRSWQEWRIALDHGQLVWEARRLSVPAAWHQPVVPDKLATALPDGYTVEVCAKSAAAWRACAQCLVAGKLLTIDYGFTAEEWLRPERTNGTLRAYTGHRVADNILDNPGGQDITAHVNFSALQSEGEKAGLRTDGLWRQEKFLTNIFAQTVAASDRFAPWTPERVRQFQTLTHPQHLGETFRVLVQSR